MAMSPEEVRRRVADLLHISQSYITVTGLCQSVRTEWTIKIVTTQPERLGKEDGTP